MRSGHWSQWAVLLGAVGGCNAKLSVDPGTGGAGGETADAGAAGAGAGSAGRANNGGEQNQAGAPGAGFSGAFHGGGVGGDAQPGGGSGGAVIGPIPGQNGQPCIPGATASTGSGVAATPVTTLAHCFQGLSCNSAGKCGPIPQCPQTTGECIEYGTVSAGGTGGMDGSGGASGAQNNAGAQNAAGAGNGGTIQTPDESGVTGIAIDSARLYWIEYGTRDAIGNYQNDGALMTMKLSDRSTAQLGPMLAGPKALGLTSTHAYVMVDGAGLIGTVTHAKLLRIALADGTSEVVQDGSPPLNELHPISFAAVADTLYWSGASSYFSLASNSTTPVAGVSYADDVHSDGTALFFTDASHSMARVTLAGGGAAVQIGIDPRPFDLNGDWIYGLEYSQGGGMLLTKSAKSSGTWTRVRALGEVYPSALRFVGDRYFYAWGDGPNRTGITTATLGTTTAPIRLLDPDEGNIQVWAGGGNKLYWNNGAAIVSRVIPTP